MTIRWLYPATAALAVGTLAIAACGSDGTTPTSRVFGVVPWTGAERATYDVLDEGGRVDGTCTLMTEPSAPVVVLRQHCEDAAGNGHSDTRVVEVNAETLVPIRSERVIVNAESGKRTTFAGEYRATDAVLAFKREDIATGRVEEERTTERALPAPGEENPDPGYYDDDSLFWLLRGIPLEEDWKGAYNDVNAGIGRIFVTELRVEGRERVSVPAGAIETWRIRVKTASVTQLVWVEVDRPHRLVQAAIERSRYVLRSSE